MVRSAEGEGDRVGTLQRKWFGATRSASPSPLRVSTSPA